MFLTNKGSVMLKIIPVLLSLLIFPFNYTYAGCGSCKIDKSVKKASTVHGVLNQVPGSGKIVGSVHASCGMCNFGVKTKEGCDLSIKIGENVYGVRGTSIEDHGDSHAEDGFCNAIRTASVSGYITGDYFIAESFELLKD